MHTNGTKPGRRLSPALNRKTYRMLSFVRRNFRFMLQRKPNIIQSMVVLIHGGPASALTADWPASFGMPRAIVAALSSRGYYVLMPNPRGSYGSGGDFARA